MPGERKASGGVWAALIVAAVLAIVVGFLLVVAGVGALLYARARAAQEQAMAARHEAIAEAMRARLVLEAEREQTDAERVKQDVLMGLDSLAGMESEPRERRGTVVEILVDAEGRLTIDQQLVAPEELAAKLQAAREPSVSALAVILRIDEQCPMEQLSEVLRICRRLRIGDIRLRTETPAGGPSEPGKAD